MLPVYMIHISDHHYCALLFKEQLLLESIKVPYCKLLR